MIIFTNLSKIIKVMHSLFHSHTRINTWPPWMPGVISALYCLLCYCALTHPPFSSLCIALAPFVFLSMLQDFWSSVSAIVSHQRACLLFLSPSFVLLPSLGFFPPPCACADDGGRTAQHGGTMTESCDRQRP